MTTTWELTDDQRRERLRAEIRIAAIAGAVVFTAALIIKQLLGMA